MFSITNCNRFKNQNIGYVLAKRELGPRVFLNRFGDYRQIKNMTDGKFEQNTITGHKGGITAIDIQGYFVVTASLDDTIKLWDLQTGKCRWTFNPKPRVIWGNKIKIVDDHIVCAGIEKPTIYEQNKTVRIINFQTGSETASIIDNKLEPSSICVLGRQIFCASNDGNIKEWNLNGSEIRLINSEFLGTTSQVFGFENFLVHISHNIILIHNLQNNSQRKLKLESKIESARINNRNFLTCGFDTGKKIKNNYDFCVIDLENGKISHKYQMVGAFTRSAFDIKRRPYLTESGTIWSIIKNSEWVYIGHSTGKLVAFNLDDKSHHVLGEHKTPVLYLALQGQILISGSPTTTVKPGELKIWDIKSLKRIAEVKLPDSDPDLNDVLFDCGRLFVTAGKTLIQWNYHIVSNENSGNDKNSPAPL